MAIMNAGAAAGVAAAAAAAAAKRRADAEEEKMSGYRPEDLEGWEFKFLRSGTSAFKKPERLAEALEQESLFGWELVEKFDDARLRLKRGTDERKMDMSRDGDPYRSWYGTTPNQVGLRVAMVLFALMAMGTGLAFILSR